MALLGGLFVAVPAQAAAPQSVVAASPSDGVKAADLSKFNPGNIISDAAFFDSSTMTESQIQAFLEARVPRCEAGYVCLRDWYDTSRSTNADAMCGSYSGGTRERASTIIYKVARACGINPQVILATLEKEQGLVTHVWPSEWRYTIAMGQGCPDTAACDTRYYGFFNQVYGAAWQFKRYANPPGTSKYFTWYAPGKTWNVRWNPNEGCGSSPVYIQNQATANLYYFTPYQPNAAAIRAGYGEGDGCSSYGNRNFYQRYMDWFGSTQRDPAAEIDAEYLAQGGSAALGAPVSGLLTLTKNGGGFARAYSGGSIYWTTSTGAKTLRPGALRDYYFARNGADGDLGWPSSNQQTVTGVTSTGVAQAFTGGSVYSSTSGTFGVSEPIRGVYFAYTGAVGQFGWPTGDQTCAAGVCTQSFEGGVVVSSAAGTYGVYEPVRAGFTASGGPTGAWGVPVSAVAAVPQNGGGFGQAFAKSSVYFRSGAPAYAVSGAVRDHYFSLGGAAGSLGFPVGDQQCSGSTSCQQQFQLGWIIWNSSVGARVGAPAIDAAYDASGGPSGVLGARAGSLVAYGYNGGGLAQPFANGAIFYKNSATTAYAVTGVMRDLYFSEGGAAGRYGWPTSAMSCASDVCTQQFEGGTVTAKG